MEALLEQGGADVSATDDNGFSALDMASGPAVLKLLTQVTEEASRRRKETRGKGEEARSSKQARIHKKKRRSKREKEKKKQERMKRKH